MQLKHIAIAMAISSLTISSVYANTIVGVTSNNTKIKVGAIKEGSGHSGDPENSKVGIQVNGKNSPVLGKMVDLAGLKAKAESNITRFTTNIGGQDSANIVQLDFNKWNLPSPVPDHKPLGKFSYKELPNNIYFGEWHQGSTTNGTDKDRAVFYVGKNPSNNLPTSGTATYQVTGINQYNGSVNNVWSGWTGKGTTAQPNNLLHGKLTADFGAKKLTGTLNRAVNGGANVTNKLDISADIKAQGSISGDAIANSSVTGGKVNGHFFGSNGASIAGIATFDGNSKFDTAFGGNKQ